MVPKSQFGARSRLITALTSVLLQVCKRKASFTQALVEGTLHQMITAHVLISAACTRYAKKQLSAEKLRRENVKD